MGKSWTITFAGDRIGLIVRGKTSHAHNPGVMEQHADCVLSNGAPVGFFGEGNGGSSNGIGMGMKGEVYDYSELGKKRAPYVDKTRAKTMGVVSTVVLVDVSTTQAKNFDDFWAALDKAPGDFNLLGGNCSSHASDAFITAGILGGGIPGLDTPDNLYLQICREKKGKCYALNGYIGFSAFGSGYIMMVDT